jgi:hypothetical protein
MTSRLLLCITLLAVAPAVAVPYSNAELRYSLSLPEGWAEMPPEVVGSIADRAAEATGRRPIYISGWGDARRPWVSYPYVLVQHREMSDQTLGEISAAMEKVSKGPSPVPPSELIPGAELGQPVADPEHKSIMIPMQVQVAGIGTVKAISILRPGRLGLVQLSYYSLAEDFEENWEAFQPYLDSFRFEEGFGYTPAGVVLSKAQTWVKLLLPKALVGGLIGALVAWVMFRRRKP